MPWVDLGEGYLFFGVGTCVVAVFVRFWFGLFGWEGVFGGWFLVQVSLM